MEVYRHIKDYGTILDKIIVDSIINLVIARKDIFELMVRSADPKFLRTCGNTRL